MTTQTQAAWRITPYGGDKPSAYGSLCIASESGIVCDMNLQPIRDELKLNGELSDYARRVWDEQRANARLIAQAPAMLEVLRDVARLPHTCDFMGEPLDCPNCAAAIEARDIIERIDG